MLQRLTERKEWKFFAVLPKADAGLAAAWWTALLLRGILPAAFAIAMGVLVGAVQRGHALAAPLALAGGIFVLLQVLAPIQPRSTPTWGTAPRHGFTTGSPRPACARLAWGIWKTRR